MKTTASLTLSFTDAAAREDLVSVLAPDNEDLPRGLDLSVASKGKTVQLRVSSSSPSTSLSTALAFLSDIALFEEVWLLSHRKNAGVRGG